VAALTAKPAFEQGGRTLLPGPR